MDVKTNRRREAILHEAIAGRSQGPARGQSQNRKCVMFNGLPVQSLPLGRLLAGAATYAIPAFQRPYAWGVEEARQLLDDILTASGIDDEGQAQPDYYLGMLLLLCDPQAPLPGDPSSLVPAVPAEPYQIIDGQQRVLTLTILFSVLRDACNGDAAIAARLAGLVSIPSETGTLGDQMVALPRYRLGLNGRERAFFQRNVQRAGACRPSDERDEAPSEAAQRIFAVRDAFIAAIAALPAAARTRLAEYLIGRCHVVVMLSHDIDRAHLLFTVMNERGKPLQRADILKASVLSEVAADDPGPSRQWDEIERLLGPLMEEFLSHLRAVHGRSAPRIVADLRNLVRDTGGASAFLNNVMLPYAHILAGISAASHAVEIAVPYAHHLVYLNRLNGSEWKPAVMLVLRRYATQPEVAVPLIAAIDRMAYALRVLCHGGGKRTARFNAIIRAIDAGEAMSGEADVFRLSREEARTAAYNLRDLHDRNPQISKLLLLRINDLIEGGLRSVNPSGYSVEHVLPQRPPATSEWREVIADPELRALATESLGNLTLVPQSLNQKARNSDFAVKRGILEAAITPETDLAIMRDVVESPAWTLDTIAARERWLLAAAGSFLGVDVTDVGIDHQLRRGSDGLKGG